MSPIVLYVIGPPGIGKTSLVRSMLGLNQDGTPQGKRPVGLHRPKWTETLTELHTETKDCASYHVCAAGHYTGMPFDGGDTVPYTGALEALAYWHKVLMSACWLTILDGDRFSTQPSLEYVETIFSCIPNARILGVHLVASPETLAARRSQREGVTSKAQNETWVKGRVTKARNFAQKIGALELNAEKSTAELHLRVSRYLKEGE